MAIDTDQSVDQSETSTWWLTRWLKSDAFWQAIVVQTLGTLAAAVIIALVAIFVGIGYPPAVRYFVIYGLAVLATIMLAFILVPIIAFKLWIKIHSIKLYERHPVLVATSASLLSLLVFFVGGGGVIALLFSVEEVIASWTGYSARG